MWNCRECNASMDRDAVAVYMRMIDRRAEDFLCKACLSKDLGCTVADIDRKIEQFKHIGCVLFTVDDPPASVKNV